MKLEIDHVAIKVTDIEKVSLAFNELGYSLQSRDRYEELAMDIAFLGEGSGKLELLQAIDSSSPISTDPDGIHHIAVKVNNIEESYSRMSGSDKFMVEGPLRQGAHSRIFFFRITGEQSTLYECVESVKGEPHV